MFKLSHSRIFIVLLIGALVSVFFGVEEGLPIYQKQKMAAAQRKNFFLSQNVQQIIPAKETAPAPNPFAVVINWNNIQTYSSTTPLVIPLPSNFFSQSSLNKENQPIEWKTYKNLKYKFSIRYPKEWPNPSEIKTGGIGFPYEYKISFKDNSSQGVDNGFDILVYNASENKKTSQNNTEALQNNNKLFPAYDECDHLAESPDKQNACSASEVPFVRGNYCYKKTEAYQIKTDSYAYNMIPADKNMAASVNSVVPQKTLPEIYQSFFSITLEDEQGKLNNIMLGAIPHSPRAAGHMVCPYKNDHPSTSSTKSKHMDEDCCADFDEWPNPMCFYPANLYTVMLAGSPSKKKK